MLQGRTTQGCNNTAISWLYRTCWNNLTTSLIISTRLLQVVNSLFQTCWQAVRKQLLQLVDDFTWQTCYKMWDFYACMWLLALQLFKNSIGTQGKAHIEPPLFECEWAFRIQACQCRRNSIKQDFQKHRRALNFACAIANIMTFSV
jgi:hypothetical protein